MGNKPKIVVIVVNITGRNRCAPVRNIASITPYPSLRKTL